jgi:N-acetylglutamate synthase-like GNAT family acetyltransferase
VTSNPLVVTESPSRSDLVALARRLELAEALAGVEFAATLRRTGVFPEATSLALGGGYGTFAGAGSPLTQAFGLGLHGSLPAAEIDRLGAFFHGHGAPSAIELSAPADPSLERAFLARGYQVVERSEVLTCRSAEAPEAVPAPVGVTIRRAGTGELGDLARVVAAGSADDSGGGATLPRDIEAMFRMVTTTVFVAETNGKAVGGGVLLVHRRVGILCAAAVLPEARGRGIHQALLRERLAAARALKCESVMIVAQAGTASHRNAGRAGFTVVYPRAKYRLDP